MRRETGVSLSSTIDEERLNLEALQGSACSRTSWLLNMGTLSIDAHSARKFFRRGMAIGELEMLNRTYETSFITQPRN